VHSLGLPLAPRARALGPGLGGCVCIAPFWVGLLRVRTALPCCKHALLVPTRWPLINAQVHPHQRLSLESCTSRFGLGEPFSMFRGREHALNKLGADDAPLYWRFGAASRSSTLRAYLATRPVVQGRSSTVLKEPQEGERARCRSCSRCHYRRRICGDSRLLTSWEDDASSKSVAIRELQ
jgi:hypothetical protein